MASEPSIKSSAEPSEELERLRARIDALERENAGRMAKANAALAAAQDRSYWLDRWDLDLNALMRRRGASEFRAALRALRAVYRFAFDTRVRLRWLPQRLRETRDQLARERGATSGGALPLGARQISPDSLAAAPVTELLHARLTEEDRDAVVAGMGPAERASWEAADNRERKRLTLAFAAHHGLQPALEHSGLSAAMPPPGVHSMARSAAAAGGSTYYADLVLDALTSTGFELRPGAVGLDFGCSSGRVVRVLATAYPELEWHGCDPIPEAIEWARENLPGIRFGHSPEYPPLAYPEGGFDFVFAISIWSHFSESAAVAWLEEMRRLIRPGGRLLITTHGQQTIAHSLAAGLRSAEQLAEVSAALYERGFWYRGEFGVEGDHGVANPDWGTAFLTPEWLLQQLTPAWRLGRFAPGRVEDNQDLYVLERR